MGEEGDNGVIVMTRYGNHRDLHLSIRRQRQVCIRGSTVVLLTEYTFCFVEDVEPEFEWSFVARHKCLLVCVVL